jgi:hybrid cluster-associated redox disulfide protein
MEINKEMTIDSIIAVDRGIANILMASGMHCLGCVMASGENLEQACAVHGIDCDQLVATINDWLAQKNA